MTGIDMKLARSNFPLGVNPVPELAGLFAVELATLVGSAAAVAAAAAEDAEGAFGERTNAI